MKSSQHTRPPGSPLATQVKGLLQALNLGLFTCPQSVQNQNTPKGSLRLCCIWDQHQPIFSEYLPAPHSSVAQAELGAQWLPSRSAEWAT